MSIEKQNMLKFIPIVNFLTVFFWIKLCYEKNVKKTRFLGDLMVMFACGIIYSIIQILMNYFIPFPMLMGIVTCISVYLLLLAISWLAVHAQIKILRES